MSNPGLRLIARGALGSIAVAVFWGVVSSITPTTNYYLAPLLVVLAAPAIIRLTSRVVWEHP